MYMYTYIYMWIHVHVDVSLSRLDGSNFTYRVIVSHAVSMHIVCSVVVHVPFIVLTWLILAVVTNVLSCSQHTIVDLYCGWWLKKTAWVAVKQGRVAVGGDHWPVWAESCLLWLRYYSLHRAKHLVSLLCVLKKYFSIVTLQFSFRKVFSKLMPCLSQIFIIVLKYCASCCV